ncbi:cytochrome d ubiquinol oxidase subunit I [Isoptericola jiangsuensis]|uniref:Cytochrome d ubiquinol oxidase subunit I n=1 Tax=Isoptericola jiangsuensis TaxID=548579 RepID=A0A2A9F2J4_9MICO|nr:cytochrome ubiquinol oxidase subunit I [Isoptericola jiangsuensis]PFG44730.1 cytochrome d ubiquinol oxidase subunit I [Isoptericola jiangsuensis]
MTAVDAARLQFALLAGIHFLFVLVTLGLGPVVAVFQTRWALTGREVFERATRFWGQLYLVNYALGVAAGIVMELQLGLHFPGLLEVAGGVVGAPLVVETMLAFFLESTFLGVWVFGWHLLPRAVHTAALWGVVATGYLSAFTVMVANGFLRHPVGYVMVDGEARIADAGALVTNPAALVSSFHALGACLMAGGFLLVGVSVRHLRRVAPGADDDLWRRSVRAGLVTGTAGSFVAIASGFAQFTYFQDGEAARVPVVGIAYGVMDLVAFMTFLSGVVLLLLLVRGALFRLWRPLRHGLYRVLTALLVVPFATALLGWVAREVGRQPWAVVGVLRTQDAVSDASLTAVLVSLVLLVGVMGTLAVTDWTVLTRLARRGDQQLALGAPPADLLGPDPTPDVLAFGSTR